MKSILSLQEHATAACCSRTFFCPHIHYVPTLKSKIRGRSDERRREEEEEENPSAAAKKNAKML
jgi:hypothetical protein